MGKWNHLGSLSGIHPFEEETKDVSQYRMHWKGSMPRVS